MQSDPTKLQVLTSTHFVTAVINTHSEREACYNLKTLPALITQRLTSLPRTCPNCLAVQVGWHFCRCKAVMSKDSVDGYAAKHTGIFIFVSTASSRLLHHIDLFGFSNCQVIVAIYLFYLLEVTYIKYTNIICSACSFSIVIHTRKYSLAKYQVCLPSWFYGLDLVRYYSTPTHDRNLKII